MQAQSRHDWAAPTLATRLLAACIAAGFATTLCFLLMVVLLGDRPETSEAAVVPNAVVRLAEPREMEQPPTRTQPRKLTPVENPPALKMAELALESMQQPGAEIERVGSMADLIGPIDIQLNLQLPDDRLTPTVVVQPIYPLVAEMKQIEGYVVVSFAVRDNGTVVNPVVVESEPETIFDQAAIHAISRFRFSPRAEMPTELMVAENKMRFVFSLDELQP